MRFKTKMVRLHMFNTDPSIEGILIERPANGFYRLAKSELVIGENQNVELGESWVPKENVMFVQVLAE